MLDPGLDVKESVMIDIKSITSQQMLLMVVQIVLTQMEQKIIMRVLIPLAQ